MKVGEVYTLVSIVYPSHATNKSVIWSSSNTAVATVDSDGKVTAVGTGEADITCTTVDGGYSTKRAVNVTAPVSSETLGILYIKALKFNDSGLNIFKFENGDFICYVFDENGNAAPFYLSQERIDEMELNYREFISDDPMDLFKVGVHREYYQNLFYGKLNLDLAVEDGLIPIPVGSDEYYAMWVIMSEIEGFRHEIAMVNQELVLITALTAVNVGMLAGQTKVINEADISNTLSTTKLYRVVSQDEYYAIVKDGGKFSVYDYAMEQKWFATTPGDAVKWGKIFYPDGVYKLIEIEVPTSSLGQMYYSPKLDNIGPAFCGEVDFLNSIMEGLRLVE